MSAWPGKFVIGLTGNIATGKSVVRKMLEHLGAYTIDADVLAHRAIDKGAPGYQPVVDTFGKWILGADGQIDRKKLGRLVFNDTEALAKLEDIVHPLVGQAVDVLVRRAEQRVVVIEAIKLLESNLRQQCDSIWVVVAPPDQQMKRLVEKRGMDAATAQQRITAQGSQEAKMAAADVVIRNDGSFEATWKQVVAAWRKLFQKAETGPTKVVPAGHEEAAAGTLEVVRGKPRQAAEIAAFLTEITRGKKQMSRDDVMAAFGEKAFMLLMQGGQIVGLAGWQVENLVTRIDELYLKPGLPLKEALGKLLGEVERASGDLLSEAALLFLPPSAAKTPELWRELGYEVRTVEGLGVRAWQEAARESRPPGAVIFFKQLRKDRILRPV